MNTAEPGWPSPARFPLCSLAASGHVQATLLRSARAPSTVCKSTTCLRSTSHFQVSPRLHRAAIASVLTSVQLPVGWTARSQSPPGTFHCSDGSCCEWGHCTHSHFLCKKQRRSEEAGWRDLPGSKFPRSGQIVPKAEASVPSLSTV